jgi:putative DNA primase/helicase
MRSKVVKAQKRKLFQMKRMRLKDRMPPSKKSNGSSKSGLVVTRASDIKAEKVKWLWRGRVSRGNVSIIAGEPGLGKSQIAAKLAAAVSRGRKWPCKEGSAPKGHVFMIIAEDGTADTVRPRLEAAGANLRRVHIIKEVTDSTTGTRPFSLLADLDQLDQVIENVRDPRLVIIDPLSACLTPVDGQQFSGNDVAQVRGLLGRVDALAKKHDLAIVFISHLTKASSGSALTRLLGSSAFAAAARAVFLVTRGATGSNWRILAPAKNNLGSDSTALQFRIKKKKLPSGIRSSYIVWNKNLLPITADDALANGDAGKATNQREIDELLQRLLSSGKRPAKEVLNDGIQNGFTAKQLRAASKRLGVKICNTGYGPQKKWWWELTTDALVQSAANEDKRTTVAKK